MKSCLNCTVKILDEQHYCPNCGQKTQFKDLSLWVVFKDFVKNMFNLESKIWSSFRDIWIPGKLTAAYIKGVRNTYFNPIRFFLVTLFAFFALVVFISTSFIDVVNEHLENQRQLSWQLELEEEFNNISESMPLDSTQIEVYQKRLFSKDRARVISDTTGAVSFAFGESDLVQFYNLPEDELIEKLKPETRIQKLVLLSIKKIFQSPRQGLTFIISNGAWTIIVMVLLVSLLFKLLFIRKNYLYVEHFIFHLYGHTRLLLIGFVLLPFAFYLMSNIWLFILFLLIGAIYLFLCMRKIYKQSIAMTIVKLALTGGIYFMLALLSVQGILFLSIVIF